MENVKLFLSQKSQFDLVEKIKNKKRTRASLFQSSEDRKQEIFLCGLNQSINELSLGFASLFRMQELSRKKGRGHKCWFLEWQTFWIVPLSLVWKDGRLKDRITSPSSRCVVVVSSWVFIEKEIDNAFYLLDKKTLREAGRDFDVAPPQRLCITKSL